MANRRNRSSSRATNGKKRRVSKSSDDLISGLPDEIIICILSLLTLKEAGRTSVLSKRWRYTWTTIPVLKFHDSRTPQDLKSCEREVEEEKPLYLNWVNQVLRSYRGPSIDEFIVRFDLNEEERVIIDRWLNFAMERGVKRLELDITDWSWYDDTLYTFPTFSNCNSLTSLQLKHVNVTGEIVQHYLQNCPSLEHLLVDGSKTLKILKVEGKPLSLKSLEITYCHYIEHIEISSPNLVSYKYFGSKMSLPFISTPKLADVSIGSGDGEHFTSTFLELSSYCSQLETLKLDFYNSFEDSVKYFKFPLFERLKQLQLMVSCCDNVDVIGFSCLIKACPFLDKFRLELCWHIKETNLLLEAPPSPHSHLKVVECVGFVGNLTYTNFISYLIKNAVALEKLVIQTCNPDEVGTALEFQDTKDRRISKNRAKKLRKLLKPSTTLVIS